MSLAIKIQRYLQFRSKDKKYVSSGNRFISLELIRGGAMLLLVLEHLFDYFIGGDSLTGMTNFSNQLPAVAILRIVTHNCSPVFFLISGITLGLIGAKKNKTDFSMFLITRGIWLILLELTFVIVGKRYGVHYANSGSMIIWGLGFSMLFLSAAIYLNKNVQLLFSIIGIIGIEFLFTVDGNAGFLWTIPTTGLSANYVLNNFLYSIIPFFCLMLIGYRVSFWYVNKTDIERRVLLRKAALACVVLLVIYAGVSVYSNGYRTDINKQLLAGVFFNRYPISFASVALFLAPTLMLLSLTENCHKWFCNRIRVVGRVPMCYFYIVHLYYIHLVSVITVQLSFYRWSYDKFSNTIVINPLFADSKINFYFVLFIWIVGCATLHFFCDWYYKNKRKYIDIVEVSLETDVADEIET